MTLDWQLRHTARAWAGFATGLSLAWVIGAVAHVTLELTLERLQLRLLSSILIEAAVAGTVTALLVGVVIAAFRYRDAVLRKQLTVVAELNHQVRNSLEIISSSTVRIADKETVITILEAVMRIDATLRNLFPARAPGPRKSSSR